MGKWIKRLFTGLGVLLGALVVLLSGIVLFDSFFGPTTAEVANTSYVNGENQMSFGFLAGPEGPGPHPAVLLLHEWWGLNEGMTILADALAEEGYVVFAPDVYRGRVTAQVPRALFWRLTTPPEQVEADVDAALAHLMALPNVDTERVASWGFCFGGGHSLLLGLRQPDEVPLTIVYYGDIVTDPDLLEPLVNSRGVLGIFGEEDRQIPVEDVSEFESALNTLAIPNEITIYPGVGHAFVNEDNFDQPGAAGEAWRQAVDFLDRHFKGEGS
jgi:carboxymethylenebutenolidase